MAFQIDSRILSSSTLVAQWKLSNLYLKNEARFPWFILIPRVEQIEEMYQLSSNHQQILMEEIARISEIIAQQFKPDKLNVASLGNIVSQLHIHVVGRSKQDPFWPHGIWQPDYTPNPYSALDLKALQNQLQELMISC